MISPGKVARRLLGKHFNLIGEPYRRIFVDMDKIVHCMSRHIPDSAHILDVGGGDGYLADLLLSRRHDVKVAVADLSADVGSFVRPQNRIRATMYPSTDITGLHGSFDVVVLSDVIHHVPANVRGTFLASVANSARRLGCTIILVKDIEPGNLRAKLALWGDLYITGDKFVSQVKQEEIIFPGFRRTATEMPDFPNYCISFSADY